MRKHADCGLGGRAGSMRGRGLNAASRADLAQAAAAVLTAPNNSTTPNSSTTPDSSTTPNDWTAPNSSTAPNDWTAPNSSAGPNGSNNVYSFTGQLWAYPQLAEVLSEVSGRKVVYRETDEEKASWGCAPKSSATAASKSRPTICNAPWADPRCASESPSSRPCPGDGQLKVCQVPDSGCWPMPGLE